MPWVDSIKRYNLFRNDVYVCCSSNMPRILQRRLLLRTCKNAWTLYISTVVFRSVDLAMSHLLSDTKPNIILHSIDLCLCLFCRMLPPLHSWQSQQQLRNFSPTSSVHSSPNRILVWVQSSVRWCSIRWALLPLHRLPPPSPFSSTGGQSHVIRFSMPAI